MSTYALKTIAIALVCSVLAAFVLVLARHQRLTFRYTIGWLLFLSFGAIAGLVLPVVQPIARGLGVTPGVVVSSIAVIALLAICIQLSISISGLQEQVRSLSEESALLRTDLLSEPTPDRTP